MCVNVCRKYLFIVALTCSCDAPQPCVRTVISRSYAIIYITVKNNFVNLTNKLLWQPNDSDILSVSV